MLIGMAGIIQPLEVKHSQMISQLATLEGRRAYNVATAAGEGLAYITRTWTDVFQNPQVYVSGQ